LLPDYYKSILAHFDLASNPKSIVRFGEGHIHETYLVETREQNPDYILQKINNDIFRNVSGMMNNIEAVTRHIELKIKELPGHNPAFESLRLIYTKTGQSFYQDGNDDYWRMYAYIPGTVTYQKLDDPSLAIEAGKAIGFFQLMLSDIETPLIETIPDFHNIILRISQYLEAKSSAHPTRGAYAKNDLNFVESRFDSMGVYFKALLEKAVIRPTHNDTKLNNILFDSSNKALCLVDLDTVMPGYVHFDYGDALRTMANTAVEDEEDLTKVHFDNQVYNDFTRGYLEEAGTFLDSEEIKLLPYAPIYMTFIIGLRFLTDYLNGDVYFRVHHPGHNLERARVQFRLVEEMERVLL